MFPYQPEKINIVLTLKENLLAIVPPIIDMVKVASLQRSLSSRHRQEYEILL
ncbi:hypothetical protein GXM_06155 [Nostoc sphaeroides CCNUC1]|uniref:Uncharacterized protein n=1 Tax=Nostoc sphaeroides CCNUC1 TaxID=2653204 RepID=A0A5P8W7Z2_9NOSO|nr:hypothetical protein GXM_06155 [Nostoc sphaeroides CCNUC1]